MLQTCSSRVMLWFVNLVLAVLSWNTGKPGISFLLWLGEPRTSGHGWFTLPREGISHHSRHCLLCTATEAVHRAWRQQQDPWCCLRATGGFAWNFHTRWQWCSQRCCGARWSTHSQKAVCCTASCLSTEA